MAYIYTSPLFPGLPGLIVEDGTRYIPLDLANLDYQNFLTWLSEPGNTAPEGWTGPTNQSPPPTG